jgi:hypothetical protein
MGRVKTCKGCGEDLPLDSFYVNVGMRDGRLSWCKPCVVSRYRAGRSQRQREVLAYIQQIKLARGCVDCGYNAHPAALDFDHLPGHVKEYRLATMAAGLRRNKIDAEIAKCEVVCANCHRIRTANRRQQESAAS